MKKQPSLFTRLMGALALGALILVSAPATAAEHQKAKDTIVATSKVDAALTAIISEADLDNLYDRIAQIFRTNRFGYIRNN